MSSTITWSIVVIVLGILAIWVFIWKKAGLGEGKKYGNKLAEHLKWKNNFFHTVLENGIDGPSLMVLNSVKQANVDHHQATVMLAPYLARGAAALIQRFGSQPQIDNAIPTIENLLVEWESQANNQHLNNS